MQNLWLWRANYIRWLSVRTASQVSFQSVFDFTVMLEFYFCCYWYGVIERWDRKRVSFSYFEQLTNYLRKEQCSKMRVTRSLWWLESYFDGENYSRKNMESEHGLRKPRAVILMGKTIPERRTWNQSIESENQELLWRQ